MHAEIQAAEDAAAENLQTELAKLDLSKLVDEGKQENIEFRKRLGLAPDSRDLC